MAASMLLVQSWGYMPLSLFRCMQPLKGLMIYRYGLSTAHPLLLRRCTPASAPTCYTPGLHTIHDGS